MATLNTKSFAQIVRDQATAIQAKASGLINFSIGAVLRSVAEANAGVVLWLQGLILQVLALTRLATSTGADVDTWVNDWGVYRLSATLAIGSVTYSRFTPTNSALIPVGALVQTADGTQTFAVVADPTNSMWSTTQNGYLLPAGVASVTVPVQATTGSSAGNVVAGAVNVIFSAIVGVDTVTNALPFAGGSNAETDAALKARFIKFVASLSKGTIPAIQYAVTSLQLGLQCTVIENTTPDGSTKAGYLWVTVDDGTGAPSSATLSTAALAVGNTRAGGIMWGVFAPTVITANISITITTAPGYDHPTLVAAVAAAVKAYVNTLPLGQSLIFVGLTSAISAVSPGISNMAVSVNLSRNDVVAAQNNVVKLGSLTVV